MHAYTKKAKESTDYILQVHLHALGRKIRNRPLIAHAHTKDRGGAGVARETSPTAERLPRIYASHPRSVSLHLPGPVAAADLSRDLTASYSATDDPSSGVML